jgi:hypothetical protein
MVLEEGIEPTRPCGHRILSQMCPRKNTPVLLGFLYVLWWFQPFVGLTVPFLSPLFLTLDKRVGLKHS